jgi:hypothetical protein
MRCKSSGVRGGLLSPKSTHRVQFRRQFPDDREEQVAWRRHGLGTLFTGTVGQREMGASDRSRAC